MENLRACEKRRDTRKEGNNTPSWPLLVTQEADSMAPFKNISEENVTVMTITRTVESSGIILVTAPRKLEGIASIELLSDRETIVVGLEDVEIIHNLEQHLSVKKKEPLTMSYLEHLLGRSVV